MADKTETLNLRRRVSDLPLLRNRRSNESIFAGLLIVLCSPVFLVNALLALLSGKPLMVSTSDHDCLGRSCTTLRFSRGPFKSLAMLFAVASNKMSFVGIPLSLSLTGHQRTILQQYSHILPGCFNVVDVASASGLMTQSPVNALKRQFTFGLMENLSVCVRGLFNYVFYGHVGHALKTPDQFPLFGLKVHNHSMSDAIKWILSDRTGDKGCKTGCFINVNSINLMAHNVQLGSAINAANRCFPDGAGIRLAARTLGVNIKENVNGTDLLPRLCQSTALSGQSIYLLGSAPGVASKAADNLKRRYPKLVIAGSYHGYFDANETERVIAEINASKADILLVAMGSPAQEQWLVDNAEKLNCKTALAVGGLFDFYSGNIARAPRWLRELGLEWVWRLLQEPKSKFRRYVLGNPYFLIQIYLFNRAIKGW